MLQASDQRRAVISLPIARVQYVTPAFVRQSSAVGLQGDCGIGQVWADRATSPGHDSAPHMPSAPMGGDIGRTAEHRIDELALIPHQRKGARQTRACDITCSASSAQFIT
jgi:hypothetical protein